MEQALRLAKITLSLQFSITCRRKTGLSTASLNIVFAHSLQNRVLTTKKKSENNSRFRPNYHVTNFSQTQFTYTLCIIKLQKMTQILQEPCLVKTLLFNAPLVNPKKIEVYFIIAIDCTLYQLHQYNKNTRDVGKTCKQFVNSSPLACDYKLFKHSPNIQKWFITLLNQQQVHFIAFIEKKLNFHGLTSAISNKVLTNQGSSSISVIL